VPDQHLDLTIKTTSGTISERFNRQNRASKVLEVAVRKVPLNANPSRPYLMRLERDGRQLDPNEKLVDQDVRDGDVVLIQAGQPVDG
jgi:uncharacterized ubiquitin-like protein YukD